MYIVAAFERNIVRYLPLIFAFVWLFIQLSVVGLDKVTSSVTSQKLDTTLELAAKALVRASSGVSEQDGQFAPLSKEEILGGKYVKEQGMLVEAAQQRKAKVAWSKTMEEMSLAEGLQGNPSRYTQRTFDYTTQDQLSDFISRREEGLYRTGQVGQAIIGAAGTVGMGAGALGLEGYSLGLGTVGATALAGGAYTSYEHAKNSIENITGPYQLQEGLKTQQSFKTPTTGSYITEKGGDVVMSAAVGVGSAKLAATGIQALQKAATKVKSELFKHTTPSDVARKPSTTTMTEQPDPSNLYTSQPSTRVGSSEVERVTQQKQGKKVDSRESNKEIVTFEKGPDGSLKIKHDPLEGTAKETLDVRSKDRQNYKALKEAERQMDSITRDSGKSKSSKVIDFMAKVTKVFKNISGE
jgi:hypothetical protein